MPFFSSSVQTLHTPKYCGQEIDHAVQNGKRLIPLIIRETKGDEVHSKLFSLNWIFFRQEDDFDVSITKLLTSILTDFDWVETHRRLQVKALEWERNHKENSFLLRGIDLGDAVIGDVVMGQECSVWFHAVIRGDVNYIRIGNRTNIQDLCMLHVTHDTHPLLIGNDVTVGHSVVLHGCRFTIAC